MHKFEEKFYLSTLKFIGRYENDEMEETMDYAEWIGEHRMLERLREKNTEGYQFCELRNISGRFKRSCDYRADLGDVHHTIPVVWLGLTTSVKKAIL